MMRSLYIAVSIPIDSIPICYLNQTQSSSLTYISLYVPLVHTSVTNAHAQEHLSIVCAIPVLAARACITYIYP
jgi:hypothetical protein